jgi:lactoylglutathione lyase
VGIEVNLIVNAERSEQGNVLLDAPVKHPGYTHLALRVPDVRRAHEQAQALGFNISEGPLQLGDGWSFFVRDPDGNVIELRAPGP